MIEVRETKPDELRATSETVSVALMSPPVSDEEWATRQPSWEQCDSVSAWDGDRCVGHAGGYPIHTLVPGGARLATSAVTRVGVLPTHRRRGIARDLLTRLIEDSVARGQVLASLRASEAAIYPRYGFGLAGRAAEVRVDPVRAVPLAGRPAAGTVRLLRPAEILDLIPPIYERVAARPGVISRPDWMWRRYLENALPGSHDSAEHVVVHASAEGVDDGFVHYGVKWKTGQNIEPAGVGEIMDVWGADPTVELALWQYLLGVDLVREWVAEERPVDDVVRLAVADDRAYRPEWAYDEQWLRLLDVDAALRSRRYRPASGAVTIAVTDDALPANTGVWEISADGVDRLGAPPRDGADIDLHVRDLAATYLGGTSFTALAGVGRITAHRPDRLTTADALFTEPAAPFCGSHF
ncbi:GNAT family N-acetyltransferase [soil metagenome]